MVHRSLFLRQGKPLQEDYLPGELLLLALNTQQCQQLAEQISVSILAKTLKMNEKHFV